MIDDAVIPIEKKSKKKHQQVRRKKEFDFDNKIISFFQHSNSLKEQDVSTTNEIQSMVMIDKKTIRKRIKHFLKKYKSSDKSIKSQSKLAQIQKIFLKNQSQYQSIIINEVVR